MLQFLYMPGRYIGLGNQTSLSLLIHKMRITIATLQPQIFVVCIQLGSMPKASKASNPE